MRAGNYDCDRKVNGECLELKQVSTQRQLPPAPAANDSCSVGGPSSDDTIASRLTPLVDRMLLRPAVVQMPAAAGGAGLTIYSFFICLLFFTKHCFQQTTTLVAGRGGYPFTPSSLGLGHLKGFLS